MDQMDQNEKLEKVCRGFASLSEEQKDYILGILQALVFAKNTSENPDPVNESGKNGEAH